MYIFKKSYRVFCTYYIIVWGQVFLHFFFLHIPQCQELKSWHMQGAKSNHRTSTAQRSSQESSVLHRSAQDSFCSSIWHRSFHFKQALITTDLRRTDKMVNEIPLSIKSGLGALFINIHQNKHQRQRSPHTCFFFATLTLF